MIEAVFVGQLITIGLVLWLVREQRRPMRVVRATVMPLEPVDQPILGRAEAVAQAPSYPPQTLLLFNRGGALTHEVTTHCPEVPRVYTYAAVQYQQMIQDSLGRYQFQEL